MQHYALDATTSGRPDPTHQPARASVAVGGGPPQTVRVLSDAEITKAVVTEIVRIEDLLPTRELRIITSDGRVTLTGRVKTKKQKAQLGAAAARAVGEVNVINQLETR
jgi:osmotically-inducible protein OsmY